MAPEAVGSSPITHPITNTLKRCFFVFNCIKPKKKKLRYFKILTEAFINLTHKLDLLVTAEDVETQEQLEIFSELKCDRIQGYYYYKPLPIYEIKQILVNHNNFNL